MIQLVLVFCLSSGIGAGTCVENRPLLETVATPMGCMVAAQPVAADFLREHPLYTLRSWRCEIGHPAEKRA